MKKPVTYTLLTFVLTATLVSAQQSVSADGIAITHISVIDTKSGRVRQDMTVVVRGDRISQVAPAKRSKVPDGVRSIDGRGKFLIPGLWDMHVHVFLEGAAANNLKFMPPAMYFRLFIANGVTGFRDMGGTETPEQFAKLRRASTDGSLMVPKFTAAGPVVDGPKPIWPLSLSVATAEEGRKAVDEVQAGGFDFLKVYSVLPRDVYFAIADEAHRRNFVFVGHVPNSVTPLEASNSGQKSMEHLLRVLTGCSRREDEFNAMWREAVAKGEPTDPVFRKIRPLLLPSYDRAKATSLFQAFTRNQTWQVPTLTVLRWLCYQTGSEFSNDPRLQYIPAEVRNSWNPTGDFRVKGRSPEERKVAEEIYAKYFDVVREMRTYGVQFLAGTDVGNNYIFPGSSLHDELSLLVKAGLSPLQALQSATSNPAQFMGREADFGSIEPGKMADLVVLDANPVEDIQNVRRVRSVVLSGKYFDRDKLDALLTDAKTEAQESRNQSSLPSLLSGYVSDLGSASRASGK